MNNWIWIIEYWYLSMNNGIWIFSIEYALLMRQLHDRMFIVNDIEKMYIRIVGNE